MSGVTSQGSESMAVGCDRLPSAAIVGCLVILSLVSISASAAQISPSSISRLQRDLTATEEIESTLQKRRYLKRVIRQGESLFEENQAATNRFAALAVVFEGRQKLFVLDDSDRNRDELMETCQALAGAPDDQAQFRLSADSMLTQIDIAYGSESTNEVATAITRLVIRYKGTSAEAESLMIASAMAMETGSAGLLKDLRKELSERFGAEPRVKAFLRERFNESKASFLFGGSFERTDGTVLRFPVDRLGHVYLVCFWSEESDYLDERLLEIRALQDKFQGRFEVFSFNLDELRDCGQGTLKRLGLAWTAMRLPGGRASDAYLAYGHAPGASVTCIAVNERGYSRGLGFRWAGKVPSIEDQLKDALSSKTIAVRDPSYFALMRSLMIGDFLVADPSSLGVGCWAWDVGRSNLTSSVTNAPSSEASVIEAELNEIQVCFPPPGVRIRLSKDAALTNYRKAEELCAATIKDHPDVSDLHLVRDRRIIALMGMWNLSGEPKHLEAAVKEANDALGTPLPVEASVIPRFCLATSAVREAPEDAASIVSAFIEKCGGTNAPGTAHAAAVILALEAHNRELYMQHREIILAHFSDDPGTVPVASFFLGRSEAISLFRASGLHGYQYRFEKVRVDDMQPRVLRASVPALEGDELVFPAASDGKHRIIVILEPDTDGESAALHRQLLGGYWHAVKDHRSKGLGLTAVFLTSETNLVHSVMEKNKWTFPAAYIPGGTNSALAVRLGAFAGDRLPRTYLVDPDGRITTTFDGVAVTRGYHGELNSRDRRGNLNIVRSVKLVIRAYDVALGRKALSEKRYEEAARRLAISFPGKPVNSYNRSARYSLQANLALENWEAALKDVDTLLRDPSWRNQSWRDRDNRTRADILKKLGRQP